jgi:hypothetical protein
METTRCKENSFWINFIMGKRSNFERIEKDFYPTPYKAILPLLPHLSKDVWFYEPCCGANDLINHLETAGHTCIGSSDSEVDATTTKYNFNDLPRLDCFITNPPWTRSILHPIIENLRNQAPTWLLFDAGWMHTKQSIPYLHYCSKIVSVGRLKWIPNSAYSSLDDCCWYLFEKEKTSTIFIGPIE